jgi:membrane protease YdiL (CAAX protease family)
MRRGLLIPRMMRLFAGLVVLYIVLQGAASGLGSTRGEWGLVVALLVVSTAVLVQRLVHAESWRELGLGAPAGRGIWTAIALISVLVAAAAGYLGATGGVIAFESAAPWLLLGMFGQGGIAEELVFRGYLFGRLRRTRSFWPAAFIATIPFAIVHVSLFLTLPWPLALAALVMSVALTFPFAWLFELGGRTIWPPALLHAALQAPPKLISVDDPTLPLLWMAASTVLAWSVFLIPRRSAVAARQ